VSCESRTTTQKCKKAPELQMHSHPLQEQRTSVLERRQPSVGARWQPSAARAAHFGAFPWASKRSREMALREAAAVGRESTSADHLRGHQGVQLTCAGLLLARKLTARGQLEFTLVGPLRVSRHWSTTSAPESRSRWQLRRPRAPPWRSHQHHYGAKQNTAYQVLENRCNWVR